MKPFHLDGPVRRAAVASALFLTAATIVAACGDSGPTDPAPLQPASISIARAADTLTALGDTVRLSATVRDADGGVIEDVEVSWTTTDAAVATVSSNGLVEAVGNGSAAITAVAGEISAEMALAVIQRVDSVVVSPATAALGSAGETQQFTAAATDANGNPVNAPVVWSSENHAVATIDANGLVTARGSGEIAIGAAVQGVPGYAVLTVDQVVESIAFVAEPTNGVAGAPLDPAVQVVLLDGNGHRATDAGQAVTISVAANPANGSLGGTRTVQAVDGVATFANLWIDRAAPGYSLAAEAAGLDTIATSAQFDIAAGTAARVAFTTPPSDVVAGEPIGPAVEVRIEDAWGNAVADTATISLALSSNPGAGTLHGAGPVVTSGGVAAFADLWIDRMAAGYTLAASAQGLSSSTSEPFAVSAAAASGLAFTGPVPQSEAMQPIADTLRVGVRDRFGNPVAGAGVEVQLILASGPAGAVLNGDAFDTTDAGVAEFQWMNVDRPGVYTLGAVADGLEPAESDGFRVTLTVDTISAGAFYTCATSAYGPTFCWGRNTDGQLGVGDLAGRHSPTPVATPVHQTWVRVSLGRAHTCAIRASDTAECWGNNDDYQLGNHTDNTDALEPRGILYGGAWRIIEPGDRFSCGIATDSTAYCWGQDPYGALGDGTTSSTSRTPVSDPPSGPVDWIGLAAATRHVCGISTAGDAYCWGNNASGQLGNGTTTDTLTPIAVADPATGAVQWSGITAGPHHSCALSTTGEAYCWGGNYNGELGTGDTSSRLTPVRVSNPASGAVQWTQLSAGGNHTCGLTDTGAVYCWGDNNSRALGYGTSGDSPIPVPVARAESWRSVSAGENHTCAVTTDGRAFCWGSNQSGQLGDGTSTQRSEPVPIVQ